MHEMLGCPATTKGLLHFGASIHAGDGPCIIVDLLLTSSRRCLVATTRICESVQKVFDVNDLHPIEISFCQTESDVDATQLVPVHTLRRYVRTYVRLATTSEPNSSQ